MTRVEILEWRLKAVMFQDCLACNKQSFFDVHENYCDRCREENIQIDLMRREEF